MPIDPALPLNVYIGWDSRESVTADVAASSILKRTEADVKISYLKHRELRKAGLFQRPWLTEGTTGQWKDLNDDKPFSTEFSHTRFLVPALMQYKGWALFMDSDMIFLSDIKKLFALADDRYAVMCVKHHHKPTANQMKMDGRQQLSYYRKNWSSFVLFNCGHKENAGLTPQQVNFMKGADLHAFSWLKDTEIGALPVTYNYISGVSPRLPPDNGGRGMPEVIHYTDGGPWFEECHDVPFGNFWTSEYESWQRNNQGSVSSVPTLQYDAKDGK